MARRDSILKPPTSPLAPFPPLLPPELRSRAPEFYGFVAWTSTSLLFVVYFLWAILPDEYVEWLGLTWYPNREWAVLLPAYSVVVVLLAYFVYFALAIYGTPSLSDSCTFTDSRSHYLPVREGKQGCTSFARPDAVLELYDIPIGLVNRVLYHDGLSAD
ncbi:PIG-P-domain-containing protein [Guyanagaster necrorhizus]|uniref:PIG-P-domain-containing protein n=1 Tax=Guyanagaster necrorhizus TaxID=856835 RepID=A0A9P7VSV4_9AGAR|nr:PIG-P-domain-containing protein [Guyanagaster necrorhizus MCA 3950]KAG7446851.1 PIG-P-domain-containing protein [Guyanagaster necrorhizus MCA 3950]